MALTIGELVGYLTLKDSGFHRTLDKAERGLNRFGGVMSVVGKATSLAMLAGQAVHLTAALAPAAGAVLALPAMMTTAAAATATLKVGLAGVGDAMSAVADGDAKKLAEAMKELSPAAQAFVRASAAIKKEGLDPLQEAVQQKLFDKLAEPLAKAANNVLPAAQTGMVGVAGALNGMGKEALRVAATPFFKGQLAQIFDNTTQTVNTLRGGISPLIAIVMKLATLGAPLAQRMAEWAVNGAKVAAAFLKSEEGGNKLSGVAQRAGDTLASLGNIAKDIGGGIAGIFQAANTDSGSLLFNLERLTQQFSTWAQSAQGQEQIGNIFTLLTQTGAALGPVLSMLSGPLTTIASIISGMPPGVQSVVAQILAFSVVTAAIGGKLGGAITGIRLLAVGIGSIPGAVAKIGPAAVAVGAFGVKVAVTAAATVAGAARMVAAMAVGAAGMVASAATMAATMAATAARVVAGWVLMGTQSLLQAARVAAAWVLAMGPIGWIIAAVVALVAVIVANWDAISEAISAGWEWVQAQTEAVWNGIIGFLSGVWEGIKSAAAATWEWIKGRVSAFVSGVVSLFQNFTLPGLIMKHWDSIKAAAQAAWTWVTTQIKIAVTNIIAGIQSLSQIPGKVADWFAEMASKAIAKAVELIVWAKGFGAKILAGLGSLANLLLSAGKDLIMGLINGVQAMAGRVVDSVKGVVNDAVRGAKNLLGIKSPSTVFADIGKWSMQGLINGLTAEGANVKSTVEKMVDVVKKAFASRPDVADGLIDFVRVGNTNLEALALQREDLVQRLADAKELAKKVAGDAAEWASITGLDAEAITGAGDMAAELQGKASAINNFANNIQALAKRGLNKKLIQDLIDAGVEKGASFAEMMVGSDGAEIKALNKAQAAVDKASVKLGKSSADAMYDVGKKSGDGYLKGLEESLKNLDKQMTKIVKALVAAIKRELKIKSPSQVMAEIGVNTMAGYIQGLQSMESSTLAAMTGIVGQAVSATSGAAVGSVGKAASTATSQTVNTAGGSMGGGGGIPAPPGGWGWGGAAPQGGAPTVTVNMHDTVIREEADAVRLGREFGYELAVQA